MAIPFDQMNLDAQRFLYLNMHYGRHLFISKLIDTQIIKGAKVHLLAWSTLFCGK